MLLATYSNWLNSLRSVDLQYLLEPPYTYLWLAAAALLIFYLLLRLRPPSKIKAFKGDTGYVMVSRHALLELVYSACEQLPEVRKPSVKILRKRKLHLQVRIRIDGTAKLRDTSSFLQTHLKDALENNMGIEKLGNIEVVVTGIRNTPKSRPDLNTWTEKKPSEDHAQLNQPKKLGESAKPDLNAPLSPNDEKKKESVSTTPATSDSVLKKETGNTPSSK